MVRLPCARRLPLWAGCDAAMTLEKPRLRAMYDDFFRGRGKSLCGGTEVKIEAVAGNRKDRASSW